MDWKAFKDFRLWTWLQATKALDLPITEKAETWYNYFSIEGNQIKAKELLDPFRKENKKSFDIILEQEHIFDVPNDDEEQEVESDSDISWEMD